MAGESDRKKYRRIATDLRDAIRAGTYPAGSRLPGENALAAQYGVSRATARQALAQLAQWGLTTARQGSGNYVRDFRPLIRDAIKRLGNGTWPAGQSVWDAETEGRSLTVDQIEVGETADVPDRIRRILALSGGEKAVKRSRRFSVDGKAVLVSTSWLPASIAAGTAIAERDTGPGGTYARLADLGHRPVRFREDLRSRMPDKGEVERLALTPGMPVQDLIRTAVDADSTVVEVNEMTADALAYVFRYEWDA